MRMRRVFQGLLPAVALLWSGGAAVRAEPISWKVWTAKLSTGQPRPDGTLPPAPLGDSVTISNDLGSPDQSHVNFFSNAFVADPPILHVRSTTVPIALLSASWNTTGGNLFEVAGFSPSQNFYTLQVSLLDAASGKIGTVDFAGSLSGTIDSSQARLSTKFRGPTAQSLDLGGQHYTLTMGTLTSPTLDRADSTGNSVFFNQGSISIRVDAQPDVHDTPEPSTLVLGGLGLAGLAFARRRRRPSGVAAS